MSSILPSPSPVSFWTQLFGVTNAQTLIYSFNQKPTVGHWSKWNPVDRKLARPRLNCVGFICSASSGSSSRNTSGSSTEGNPNTFGSLEEFSDLRWSRRFEKEKDANVTPVPSTFDFLKLKRELEKGESSKEVYDDDDELRLEDSEAAISCQEKDGIVVGSSWVKGGRQVIRMSNLLAKQVIIMESARSLGFVSQLWVDTKLWVVALIEVRPNFLSGDTEKILLDDVYQVGDVMLVSDESVMEKKLNTTGLDTLVGYDVVKFGKRGIGKIREYTFNIKTGAVETLEFDSFGFSIIPSSLVSTYGLSVEDVVYVESDKVFVYEEALSQVQRITKGIWDTGNIGKSKEYLENHDFRRKRAYFDHRSSTPRSRRPKFPNNDVRDEKEDWDFPIDY